VSEIHQSDTEYYGEYIELQAMQDYI